RSEVVNEGGQGKQLIQPVEMPAGWEQETLLALQCAPRGAAGATAFLSRAPAGYTCESVDSMLAEFGLDEPDDDSTRAPRSCGAGAPVSKPRAPEEASAAGLLGRLRKKLFGARPPAASASLDRLAFRDRAAEILRRLREGAAGDLTTRWPA